MPDYDSGSGSTSGSTSGSSSDSDPDDLLGFYIYSGPHQLSGLFLLIGTIASLLFYHCYINIVIPEAIPQAVLVCLPTCLAFLTMIAFVVTRCTAPPPIPKRYWLNDHEHMVIQGYADDNIENFMEFLELIADRRGVRERTATGRVRICTKCDIVQPDRSQHCNICNCCVLRMDKHSQFFGNCIHVKNYKTSLLTMLYVCFNYTYMGMMTTFFTMKYVQEDMGLEKGEIEIGLVFTAVIVCLAVSSVTSVILSVELLHCLTNETTYEVENPPQFEPSLGNVRYDSGSWMENMRQHIGPRTAWWLLPMSDLQLDGTSFPLHPVRGRF